jgi:hypothetical protein
MFNPAHTTSERNMGTSLYWVVTSNHMSEKKVFVLFVLCNPTKYLFRD